MMPVSNTAPPAASPNPPQDKCDLKFPDTNIELLLHAVHALLIYGRHLLETICQRSTLPTFNAIAANFGTANLSTIIAHLNRGVLRAFALERFLLARAATGKDIDFIQRRITWTTLLPEPDPVEDIPPEPPAAVAAPPAPRKRAPRPSRPAGWNDPELFMPTLEELERQVRRRPIGRTIYDICLDLAVVPGFCHSVFWNELFEIMHHFGGGDAVSQLMTEKARRRRAFATEQDRVRGSNWDWLNLSREAGRQILGFFIGEPPVNPLDPAAAIATAPP